MRDKANFATVQCAVLGTLKTCLHCTACSFSSERETESSRECVCDILSPRERERERESESERAREPESESTRDRRRERERSDER